MWKSEVLDAERERREERMEEKEREWKREVRIFAEAV